MNEKQLKNGCEEMIQAQKRKKKLESKKLLANYAWRIHILAFLNGHDELYDSDKVYLPRAWMTQCSAAIKGNQLVEVKRWLNKDRRLLTLKLEGDSTALHLACEFGSPELVDTLLNILQQKNKSILPGTVGFKSVHLNVLLERALNSGDYAKCELLLKLGATIEKLKTFAKNTLLHRMVIQGNIEPVKWLIEHKALLEQHNCEGNTPLLLSVMHSHTKLTEFLLNMNANPQVKNVKQSTPLHIAAEQGNMEMLKCLLQTKAASLIDTHNANGNTSLHLAVKSGHDNVIPLLLEAGAYHKIKNEQGQTPIKLARSQRKQKTENLIVKTVREIKQAKLKETNRLNQVVTDQASEITNLKTTLQEMQAQMKLLQPAVLEASTSRSLSPLRFSLPPASISNMNPKEVAAFLTFVAEGEQDKAEVMLTYNPALALVPGDVTDLSKRTFTGITGFQYAVWALDWHMWTMIRKYLPDQDAGLQGQGFETGAWVGAYGVSAEGILNTLVQAYQMTIDLYETSAYAEGDAALVKQIGGTQRLLPAHAVNEYCHSMRPFYPFLPNFKNAVPLPRSRAIEMGILLPMEDWFTAKYLGGMLGDSFGIVRARHCDSCVPVSGLRWNQSNILFWPIEQVDELYDDQACLRKLTEVRAAQRAKLITDLRARHVQRARV